MKTILIIEDNDDIRDNVEEILSLSNYKVISAPNGKEGIEKAQKNKPDLIICGVLHVLHKDPDTQSIPFIFLTSKSERSDLRTAMEMGADDYITKPFAGNELLNAIESRFKKVDIMKKALAPDLGGLTELMQSIGSSKTLEELTNESNVSAYKKKQVVYKDGSNPHYLYYIIKGKVKTYKTHDDGKDLVMDLYNEGDFFGYTALLEGSAYKENAETMEETELAIIPRKEFEELVNSNPAIARKFVGLLAKHVSEKEKQLLGIAYNTLRKKVAEALVSLQKKYHTNKQEPYTVDISRDELATIAGTATESLIRTLSDFKSEQLIDIKSGKVIITNDKKLEHLIR
jgi:CRP/FNR family cyclic AMP-dependent transcriptional regulator